jgi:hypothetical protein
MSAVKPRMAGLAYTGQGAPTERPAWESGFADYFAEWIAPELERLELGVSAAERRLRRRAPLLILAWLLLTLLVAEASLSVPITLLWAILIGMLGAWLARAPIHALRERAVEPLRDRVLGFFGLERLDSGDTLIKALRASPLAERTAALGLDDHFWGIHQGMPFRMARLTRQQDHGRAGAGRAATGQRPSGPLVLLIPAGSATRASPAGAADSDAIRVLAEALGTRRMRHAVCPQGLLIVADSEPPELDWSHLAETWDAHAWRGSVDAAARALAARLHLVLEAAHAVSGTCREMEHALPATPRHREKI